MYESILRECGLTQNESLVYLSLLRLGKSKSGPIVKEAKVSGGKIYETLYKLVDKGLVKMSQENGIKYFMANTPSTLLNYLREKEEQIQHQEKTLEDAMPRLMSLQQPLESEGVSYVKGSRGIQSIVYRVLESAKTIRIMGVRSTKEASHNAFWRRWHFERIRLKKHALILFSDANTAYWKFFKTQKYTEVRELIDLTPSAIMIIDRHVFIFTYEPDFRCIHITQSSVAQSFSHFFDNLWRVAEKKS